MEFILRKRSFSKHCLLFLLTAGVWLFIYFGCLIYSKVNKDNVKNNVYQNIYEREEIQKENDLLELELKRQKIEELKIKNAKGLVDLYKETKQ